MFRMLWPTDIGLVVVEVREGIVGLPASLNRGHFVRRKRLESLLLRRSFGSDYFKARGNEHVFCAQRAGTTRGHG